MLFGSGHIDEGAVPEAFGFTEGVEAGGRVLAGEVEALEEGALFLVWRRGGSPRTPWPNSS